MAGKAHVAGWHARARQLWRQGCPDAEIAAVIGVERAAVTQALRIPRLVEGDREHGTYASAGLTRKTVRSRNNGVANDELDCVAMMEAIERGAKGSRRYLRRYAGEDA